MNRSAAPGASRMPAWADRAMIKPAALAAVALGATVSVADGAGRWFGGGLALLMLAIAAIDARRFIIPNSLCLAAFLLGLVEASYDAWPDALEGIGLALGRAAVLGFAFFGLREIYSRLRRREGLGLGDVKLAVVAGAWLDWTFMPLAVEIAALAALAVYAFNQIADRRPFDRAARLPFGLFFAPAIWVCWLIQTAAFQF
ncbi:Peptidase A24A prepilin type IV [Methylocella tundrae]|uniref:Peptidase A24A prepilin type IV n=2 Tax=Methylocella tundrae TaxID=227605 RepID=A0A8B6M1H4_METTU|nr:Peptidase A24A prepilin type IV [Methylocella tundrae]